MRPAMRSVVWMSALVLALSALQPVRAQADVPAAVAGIDTRAGLFGGIGGGIGSGVVGGIGDVIGGGNGLGLSYGKAMSSALDAFGFPSAVVDAVTAPMDAAADAASAVKGLLPGGGGGWAGGLVAGKPLATAWESVAAFNGLISDVLQGATEALFSTLFPSYKPGTFGALGSLGALGSTLTGGKGLGGGMAAALPGLDGGSGGFGIFRSAGGSGSGDKKEAGSDKKDGSSDRKDGSSDRKDGGKKDGGDKEDGGRPDRQIVYPFYGPYPLPGQQPFSWSAGNDLVGAAAASAVDFQTFQKQLAKDYEKYVASQREFVDAQAKALANYQYDQAIKQACGQYGISKYFNDFSKSLETVNPAFSTLYGGIANQFAFPGMNEQGTSYLDRICCDLIRAQADGLPYLPGSTAWRSGRKDAPPSPPPKVTARCPASAYLTYSLNGNEQLAKQFESINKAIKDFQDNIGAGIGGGFVSPINNNNKVNSKDVSKDIVQVDVGKAAGGGKDVGKASTSSGSKGKGGK